MEQGRRTFISTMVGAGAALTASGHALAEAPWPNRYIRVVSGGAAGGTSDIVARILQEPIQEKFKQAIVIENVPGLGGLIGAGNAARATDGYTFFVTNLASNVLSVLLYKNVPFDWRNDLPAVARCCTLTNGLVVRSDSGVTTAQQLYDLLRKDPSRRVFSSAAVGTTSHLACVMLGQRLGVELLHIPFKGAAGNLMGLMQGDVFFTIDNLPTFAPQIKSGRLRLLAVSSAERSPNYPDTPTIQETGIKDFDVFSWFGFSASKSVGRDAIQLMSAEIVRQLATPPIKAHFEKLDMAVAPMGPAQFGKFIESEMARWSEVVKAAGLQPM